MNTDQSLPTLYCGRATGGNELSGNPDHTPWTETLPVSFSAVEDPLPADSAAERLSWEFPEASGSPPSAPLSLTRFALCATESHLLLAFRCQDSDIWGTYTGRDDPLYEEEVVEAFLCPTGDLRRYFEFEVSPRNVVFDARVYSPDLHRRTMQVDPSWDCPGLQTAVRIEGPLHASPPETRSPGPETPGSWSVEMAIPFASLEVPPPAPGDVWRANFYRIDRADSPQFTAWSPTLETPPNFHVPTRFGFLHFT